MNKLVRFSLIGLLLGLFALTALPAYALSLDSARAQGLVAEKLDGYVEAVDPRMEVVQLVDGINEARKAEYARIAASNGQPVDVVAKLAAEQIIMKLKPGSLYQSQSGGWKKR